MGKPAARLTDMTAHGGTVTGPGIPTVLIGKMPAATLGDMHVCPMVTPGTPPIPHVGGPITLGSTGVLIGKKPAARLGDMAVCIGPPSSIVLGAMNVLIGETSGGSGGTGSGGSAAAAKKAAAASVIRALRTQGPMSAQRGESSRPERESNNNSATTTPVTLASNNGGDNASNTNSNNEDSPNSVQSMDEQSPDSNSNENYSIEVEFTDSAGNPLPGVKYKIEDPNQKEIIGNSNQEGKALHGGFSEKGAFKLYFGEITNAKWSEKIALVGETIQYSAAVDVNDPDEKASVFIQARRGAVTQVLAEVELIIKNKLIQGSFEIKAELFNKILENNSDEKVEIDFLVTIDNLISFSPSIQVLTNIEIDLVDEDENQKPNNDYQITLFGGEVRKGKSDSKGTILEKEIPLGLFDIKIDSLPPQNNDLS